MKKKGFKFLSRFLASALILLQTSGIPVHAETVSIGTAPVTAVDTSLKDLAVKTIGIIETEPNFSINGAFHELEYGLLIKPKMKDGKSGAEYMMAPLRDMFEKLPAKYSFDGTTGKVQMNINGKVLTMTVGTTAADLDGQPLKSPYAPEVIVNPGEKESSVYLPVKFVFETLECKVAWESARKRLVATVILTPRVGGAPLATGGSWQFSSLLSKTATEYGTETAKTVANNILEFQNLNGGWMKLENTVDMTKSIKQNTVVLKSTIDNSATITELRYLAKVYSATGEEKYAEGFMKGLNYLIDGQYENGGWAQYFPEGVGYFKNITINDNAMANVLEVLMDVIYKKNSLDFVANKYPTEIAKVTESFNKGVIALLNLQVVDTNGVKTAWAAQYDKDTLKPATGRAYELPSIATAESVKVVDFLMKISNPSAEIIDAVRSAVLWMDSVKVSGIKTKDITDYTLEFGFDRVVVSDAASTNWGRFYEIGTNKPIFSGRDGVKKYNLSDISYERRVKYSWYNGNPKDLIEKRYPAWLTANNIVNTPASSSTSIPIVVQATTSTTSQVPLKQEINKDLVITPTTTSLKDLSVKTVGIIETEPNYSVNGAFYELEYGLLIKPIMKGSSSADNMMAPLRDIFEKLPAKYTFDKNTGKVQMDINGKVLTMTVGSTNAELDGQVLTAPFAPALVTNPGEKESSLYLPVKFVFSSLDVNVAWESARKRLVATVILTPRVGATPLASGGSWQFSSLLSKSAADYGTETAKLVADNILEFQNQNGGWMKLENTVDMTKSIKQNTTVLKSTIDNSATITELRYLAKVYAATGEKRYADSFIKGLEYLVNGQYENGGWGQYFPEGVGYFKNITINDNAMANVLEVLMDVIYKKDNFAFVATEYPNEILKTTESFDKGVKALLDLQVVDSNGIKTAWAAQYDKDTLQPATGRAYELPSIASAESVKVVDFLMKIPNPSAAVVDAIKSAVSWLDSVKVTGVKTKDIVDYTLEFGFDRVVISDAASTTWGRFYEIGTNKPIFSGRDGVKRYNFEDISYERSVKYSWYNSNPSSLISTRYPKWLSDISIVSLEDSVIEVKEGTVAVLPKTVVAHLGNNITTNIKVTWQSVDTSKVGTQVIEGDVEGTNIKAKLTVNVVVKQIVSIEDTAVSVKQENIPSLPETVVVNYDNDTKGSVKVTWPSVDTSKVGAQVIEGTVEGTAIKAKLTVNVVAKQIVSIEDAEAVTITQGQMLILPETVLANFDNGLKGKVKVSWSKVDNKNIGEQTIEGTVEGTTLKTILKVKVVNSTTADSKAIEELLLDKDIKNITVEYSTENPIIASNIFNTIKGQDKVVTFESKAKDGTVIASWSFNGKDVTEDIKDIDLTVKAAKLSESDSANKAAIAEKVKNEDAFIISFAANGKLPGRATVKIKLSDSWLEGKDKNNICIYYYNEETKKAEVVAEKLKADAEGYVEFEITHNSDYFVVDKNLVETEIKQSVEAEVKNPVESEIKNSVEAQIIPKTGSMVDSNVLVGLGVILLLAGLGGILIKKRSN
jgi:PelA/Pel-15E family pectate lyase